MFGTDRALARSSEGPLPPCNVFKTKTVANEKERRSMSTKQLGNSDLFITSIGFGAWAIGGSGWEFAWGAQDDSDSIAAIHQALDAGINWIDTAAVYGLGHS